MLFRIVLRIRALADVGNHRNHQAVTQHLRRATFGPLSRPEIHHLLHQPKVLQRLLHQAKCQLLRYTVNKLFKVYMKNEKKLLLRVKAGIYY